METYQPQFTTEVETIWGLCIVELNGKKIISAKFTDQKERHPRSLEIQQLFDNYIDNGILDNSILDPKGTPFQMEVWRELINVERGTIATYSHIAAKIGRGNSVRAVASAIAMNPIALLIPCHRITPKSGGFGRYRWGDEIKSAILLYEFSKTNRLF